MNVHVLPITLAAPVLRAVGCTGAIEEAIQTNVYGLGHEPAETIERGIRVASGSERGVGAGLGLSVYSCYSSLDYTARGVHSVYVLVEFV